MFFGKLVRNIFIFLIGFVLTINIYYWSMALIQGNQETFHYVGFYGFFRNFENMPRFEYFVDSLYDFVEIIESWSGWKTALAIITLGVSALVEFTGYLTRAIVCIFIDVFRILFWILGFFGVQGYDSPILN